MELKVNNVKDVDYIDSLILTKEDVKIYDIASTYVNVVETLREFKIARNMYITGCHVRVTQSYKPRLEAFTKKIIDPVGDTVINYFDSKEHYDYFNYLLNELYSTMSDAEIAYLNDCLLCGKSENIVRDKLGMGRKLFDTIKDSAIVRFGLVFNVIVYK